MGMDTEIDRKLLNKAMDAYVNQIESVRTDAGYSGSMSDGGASHMKAQLDAFKAGLYGELPDFLKGFYQEARRLADPEYAEYQRLQKKFGGK